MYDRGFSLQRATKKYNNRYKWSSDAQMQSLADYYSMRDLEKKNLGGSASDVTTSVGADPDGTSGREAGDELDIILGAEPGVDNYGHLEYNGNLLEAAEVVEGTTFEVSNEEYKRRYGDGFVYRFGQIREGETMNDIQILLKNKENKQLMDAVGYLEVDAFQRWVFQKLQDPEYDLKDLLSNPEFEQERLLLETTNTGNPLIQYRDLIINLLAVGGKYNNEKDSDRGILPQPSATRYLRSSMTGPAERTKRRLNQEYMDFLAGMVKDALPNNVINDELTLKDLEYYFKINKGYAFDFTGEGQIGNQDIFSEYGSFTGAAKKMMLTTANLFSWVSEKLFGQRGALNMTPGPKMPDDWVSPGQETRDERKERIEYIGSQMNTYKRNITENFLAWKNGEGNSNWDLMTSASAQSFSMMTEATPYIVGGGLAAWSGAGPGMIALGMSTYGVIQDAEFIENDLRFDSFEDKETGEVYTYYGDETRNGASEQIISEVGDTPEDFDRKLKEKFNVIRNDSNRFWYLSKTFATGYVADRVTFGIFNQAVTKMSATGILRYGKPSEIAMQMLKGYGLAIPQAAIPTLIDQYVRIMAEGSATGDPELDMERAWNQAIEVTLGTMPIGPTMFGLGWAKGFSVHLAKSRVGRNGTNAYHREKIDALTLVAQDSRVSYKDRMNARREILRLNQDARVRNAEDVRFYEYISRTDMTSIDQIARLDLEIQRKLIEMKGLKEGSPAYQVYFDEMTKLLQLKGAEEAKHTAGYEASLKGVDPSTKTKADITATPEAAKKSLIEGGNKNPTPNQIAAEQVKLSEVEARSTVDWVTNNIESKPKTSLTEEGLNTILSSKKYAILTGENPKGKAQSEAENKAANDKLLKYLKDNGYVYHEVTGKFGPGKNSIIVENMSVAQAREIARIFDQQSVAHAEGLVRPDGSTLPFNEGTLKVDPTKADADNYTAVKLSDGTVVAFQKTPKAEGTGPDGKPISDGDFFSTVSENPLIKEAAARISDADAISSMRKNNTKPKGENGKEYTPKQIGDKKTQMFNDAALKATQGEGGTKPISQIEGMTPGTKAWNDMIAKAESILRTDAEADGPKNVEVVPPTIPPKSSVGPTSKPKGYVHDALSTLGKKLKGVYMNWFVTNPMGFSERGWNPFKRREGPGEAAGDIVTRRDRIKRSNREELDRDAQVFAAILNRSKRDINGKMLPKDQQKRNQKEIREYLRGNDDARIAFLSEGERASLDFARARIDGLSDIFISILSSKKNKTPAEVLLIEKMRSNQGHYLKRSYLAFNDEGKWIKSLNENATKNQQVLIDDAVKYVMNEQGKSMSEAKDIIRGYIQNIAEGFKSGGLNKGGGVIGALDATIFKNRKDIPEAFRKLLGEIEDPLYNYTTTIDQLATYIGDFTFQSDFSSHLINTGIGRRANKNGVGPQGWVRLAPEGKSTDILSNVWVTPEWKKMFDDMQPLARPGGEGYGGTILRSYLKFQARVKGWKTVYSPGTIMRNVESGTLLAANSGHWFLADSQNLSQIAKMAWGDVESQGGGLTKNKKTIETRRLTELGVIGDTARAGEYLAMLDDYNKASAGMDAAEAAGGKGLGAAKRRFDKAAQKVYAFGDDFYKLSGYYQEVRKFMKSNDPKTGEPYTRVDAEVRAAERIRGGYPTYSGLPRNIKGTRRFLGTGMFVSFAYEIPRTTANNFRYMLQDFNEGRIQMGMDRMVGMGIANGMVTALIGTAMAKYGWDEDDNEAISNIGPNHGKNSRYVPLSESDDGVMTYIDLSTIAPNEIIWAPVFALFKEGTPTMETLNTALIEVLKPYTATDATTNFVMEMMTGKKKSGGDIYYYDSDKGVLDNMEENWKPILKHFMIGVGPGYYRNVQDYARANNVAPEFFGGKANEYKIYDNWDATLRIMGISVQTFDLGVSTPFKVNEEVIDFNQHKKWHTRADKIDLWVGQYGSEGTAPEYNKDMLTEDLIDSYDSPEPYFPYLQERGVEFATKHYATFVQSQQYADYAYKSGLSEEKFLATMLNANVSKDMAAALYVNAQGEIPLSLAKDQLKQERFLQLQILGTAPETIDDVPDPSTRDIAAKRDELLAKRGDRDLAPWKPPLLTKDMMTSMRERIVTIHTKLKSSQKVIDGEIEKLYNTMALVNEALLTEWARLNNQTPGKTVEQQKLDAIEAQRQKDAEELE